MRWKEYICFFLLMILLVSCGKQYSDPTIIGADRGKYSTPRYSPDGKYIAYIFKEQLYLIDQNGNNKKKITGRLFSSRFNIEGLAWVTDKKISYLEKDSKISSRPKLSIYVYDIETGKKNLIIGGLNSSNDISWCPTNPDLAAFIMNTSNDVRNPGTRLPYLLDLKTLEISMILGVPTDIDYKNIHWFSDGENLALIFENNNFEIVNKITSSLGFININTNKFTVYPFDKGSIIDIAFKPNTNKFIYRRSPNAANNYRGAMWLGSTNLDEFPTEISDIDMVSFDWSPNGNSIIYTTVGMPGRNEIKKFEMSQ